jgi:hypothetical protein
MSESHLVPEQLNYQRKSFAGCKYKFSRIVPLSGNQQVDILISSTAEVLMEIPTNVFNCHISKLYADGAVSAQTGANHTWMHCDGMPLISEIDLYTRSGVYLCQLPNFQNYMKVVRKLYTSKDEYKSSDRASFLFPSNVMANAVPAITPSNGAGSVNFEENAYVISTASLGQAANTQINFTLEMKLGAIKKTIFALNKDIVFPDIVVLRILFGPANKAVYTSTSGNDPTAGTPALPTAQAFITPAPTTGTGVIRLYNLTLFLATEKNEDLAQSVRSLVNSPNGLNYPYSYKQNITGLSQSLSLRFNRGHGKNLLEGINSPFNNVESLNTAYDNSNVANASFAAQNAVGSKVTNYYSQLDNVRRQDITLVCGNANLDDYREHAERLKNTPILNSQVYYNNWFHSDRFYEPNHIGDTPEENLDKGMSLIVERKYDLLTNNTANPTNNWYSFAICQKDLHIGAQMIQYQ